MTFFLVISCQEGGESQELTNLLVFYVHKVFRLPSCLPLIGQLLCHLHIHSGTTGIPGPSRVAILVAQSAIYKEEKIFNTSRWKQNYNKKFEFVAGIVPRCIPEQRSPVLDPKPCKSPEFPQLCDTSELAWAGTSRLETESGQWGDR